MGYVDPVTQWVRIVACTGCLALTLACDGDSGNTSGSGATEGSGASEASATAGDESCAAAGTPAVAVGTGTGESFEPLAKHDEVYVSISLQGGTSAGPLRLRTEGLAGGPDSEIRLAASLTVDTEVVGELEAEGIPLGCISDGAGLITPLVIGLGAEYEDPDAVVALDGSTATLDLEVVDGEGNTATQALDVTLVVI